MLTDFQNPLTDRLSGKSLVKQQLNISHHHTPNASLHYVVKYLCSKIVNYIVLQTFNDNKRHKKLFCSIRLHILSVNTGLQVYKDND